MAKKQISFLLTDIMHYKISVVAKYECRTLSKPIRYLIRLAIEEFEKEHGVIVTEEIDKHRDRAM